MNGGIKDARLLLYGYDSTLLETRRSILKQAGFDTCTVVDSHGFKGAFQSASEPYDLLVICHSVPGNERISIAFLAAQKHTPIFQIERLITPQSLVSEVSRLASRPLPA